MASVTVEVDLPPGVKITAYERHQDGHGFEVRWPLPERCRCERCGHEDRAHIEYKTSPKAVRDLDVWGQPSFWIYQAPFHFKEIFDTARDRTTAARCLRRLRRETVDFGLDLGAVLRDL